MSSRKKILVFGGTGFIGSEIVDLLISEADKYDVWMLARTRYNARHLERAKVIQGTLESFDLNWLEVIKPDIIIHLARISGRGKRGRRRAANRGRSANVRLRSGIKSFCPEAHLIYVSGTLVYGHHGEEEVDEKAELNPVAYAKEYALAETPWLEALNEGELKVSMMRPPWILGSQSWFGHFFNDFIAKHNKIPVYGNGDNWMSIIDLTDCAGLILHFIESGMTNKIFNVSNPDGLVNMQKFVSLIQEDTALELKSISTKEIVSKYDQATSEAFTFSLRSVSLHQELIKSYTFKYPDKRSIVKNNLKLPT